MIEEGMVQKNVLVYTVIEERMVQKNGLVDDISDDYGSEEWSS